MKFLAALILIRDRELYIFSPWSYNPLPSMEMEREVLRYFSECDGSLILIAIKFNGEQKKFNVFQFARTELAYTKEGPSSLLNGK